MDTTTKHTADYIKELRSNGKYAFTDEELYRSIPKAKKNIRKDLDRLRAKGEIKNIRRGFYTIITDEYSNMGALPIELYADDLMRFLNKKYYVGLFSAAMLHGAAHQQPQEFYIVTASPKPRNIIQDKFIINFSEKRNFPGKGIEEKKTEAGYLKLSSKELTFFDLIYYVNNLGGINRVVTILNELRAGIKMESFKEIVKSGFPLTVYQRAGYLLEHVFQDERLSTIIEKRLMKENYRTTLLSPSDKMIGEIDNKWKVQVNVEIESDI